MSSKGEMYQHANNGNNSFAFAVARSQCQPHCLAIENATGGREMGAMEWCKEPKEQEELFPNRRNKKASNESFTYPTSLLRHSFVTPI